MFFFALKWDFPCTVYFVSSPEIVPVIPHEKYLEKNSATKRRSLFIVVFCYRLPSRYIGTKQFIQL